jgi:hypothetical protein
MANGWFTTGCGPIQRIWPTTGLAELLTDERFF